MRFGSIFEVSATSSVILNTWYEGLCAFLPAEGALSSAYWTELMTVKVAVNKTGKST